ncbi:MAG: hypothetical protein KBD10_00770 [Candidatus Pacebacteria bacterium]|nr:hypothetical protein [Candidatus Paceibacterota bacterium]
MMRKNYDQIKNLLLVMFLLISPSLWMVLGNIPVSFEENQSWFYLTTFVVLAFAVFVALDSSQKR